MRPLRSGCQEPAAGKRAARWERGEGSIIELIGMIVLLVALLDIASFIVMARPAQVAAAGASRACARMAVDTLNSGLAWAQGQAAGLTYLQEAGIAGQVGMVAGAGSNRWGAVTCMAQVDVPVGAVGLMRRIVGAETVRIEQSTTLTTGGWQSRW